MAGSTTPYTSLKDKTMRLLWKWILSNNGDVINLRHPITGIIYYIAPIPATANVSTDHPKQTKGVGGGHRVVE